MQQAQYLPSKQQILSSIFSPTQRQKSKNRNSICNSNPSSEYKENGITASKRCLPFCAHGSITHSSQDTNIFYISIIFMDKENKIMLYTYISHRKYHTYVHIHYIYNEIFVFKIEGNLATCDNLDEP